jgi:hypothetical protein
MKASLKCISAALPVLFGFALLTAGVHAQATPTQATVLTNAIVNNPIQFDVSPPLRVMQPAALPADAVYQLRPFLRPKQNLSGGSQPAVSGASPSSLGDPPVRATIGKNFDGVSNLDCAARTGFLPVPPDTNAAVGDTQIVEWVNLCYAVYDKATGNLIAGPFPGNQFWARFGGQCETKNDGDPIIQWDKANHVWVASQNTFGLSGSGASGRTDPPYFTCIAVSQTADATGRYNRYVFSQQPGFPDYPKWGLTGKVYYQTQNVFLCGTGTPGCTLSNLNTFGGVNVCAYEGAAMRAGRLARQICTFDNQTFDDSMLPADNDHNQNDYADERDDSGSGIRPEVLLGSIDNQPADSVVYEYVFTPNFRNPAMTTLAGVNGTMAIAVPRYVLPECPWPNNTVCVPQPSPGEMLDSLGDRLMYRLAHFDNDTREFWLVTHSIRDAAAVDARWYQFTAPKGSTSLTLAQSGDTANDHEFRWMGSVAMDKVGNIALGYSRTSPVPGDFPSIYYAGRSENDPPNTTDGEAPIHQGGGVQTNSFNRWGDYTSMALDGTDGCTFWYANEYYPATAVRRWATRIASLKFPNCAEDDEGEGGDDNRNHVKFNDDPSHADTSSMAYQDPSRGMSVQSVNGVRSVLYNGTCVSFTGNALVNSQPGYLYTFAACDLSALGTGIGTFSIAITGPPLFLYQKSAVLTSGHINIHPH